MLEAEDVKELEMVGMIQVTEPIWRQNRISRENNVCVSEVKPNKSLQTVKNNLLN